MKISATIITFNEADNIKDCILSLLPVTDEIVVIDSFSTDNTAAICQTFSGVKFLTHTFEGHVQQKNYAVSQTTHNFVLSLDADERLSEKLQFEINELRNSKQLNDGYFIPRLNNYCGKWIFHGGWYPDKKLRLWNKEKGQWGGENPHDKVILSSGSKIKYLKNEILHYTYKTIEQHDLQIDKFTEIAAQAAFNKGKRVIPIIHRFVYPVLSFLSNYIIKFGFLDGRIGFILSKKHAYYKYLKYNKLAKLIKS